MREGREATLLNFFESFRRTKDERVGGWILVASVKLLRVTSLPGMHWLVLGPVLVFGEEMPDRNSRRREPKSRFSPNGGSPRRQRKQKKKADSSLSTDDPHADKEENGRLAGWRDK